MGQIAGPDRGLAPAHTHVHGDIDHPTLHVGHHLFFAVVGVRMAGLGDDHAADGNGKAVPIGLFPGPAHGHDDTAPIGVLAGDGGLDQG